MEHIFKAKVGLRGGYARREELLRSRAAMGGGHSGFDYSIQIPCDGGLEDWPLGAVGVSPKIPLGRARWVDLFTGPPPPCSGPGSGPGLVRNLPYLNISPLGAVGASPKIPLWACVAGRPVYRASPIALGTRFGSGVGYEPSPLSMSPLGAVGASPKIPLG
jgi:hypothetical protein